MTTVVVFGSSSWLIKKFVQDCPDNGIDFAVVDRSFSPFAEAAQFSFRISLDRPISEPAYTQLVQTLKNRQDIVFLLAAWAGTPRTSMGANSFGIRNSNSFLIQNYSRLILDVSPSQVVFLSSAGAVYDQTSRVSTFSESSPISPVTLYGHQKLACEQVLELVCSKINVPFVALRVSTAYGYNHAIVDQGVVNVWLHAALNKTPLKIYNSLDSEINFVGDYQVSSVVNAIIYRRLNGIYNLGSAQSTLLGHLLESIQSFFPSTQLETQFLQSTYRAVRLDCEKLYSSIDSVVASNILPDISDLLPILRLASGRK